jgi:HD-like signal output (HDOD) protein
VNVAAEQELLSQLSRRGFALMPRHSLRRGLDLAADEAAHDDLLIGTIEADARLEYTFMIGANLPAFSNMPLASTVRQAVGWLGRRKIASLLWLAAISEFCLSWRPVNTETRQDFLRHSLLTGLIARQLQTETHTDSPFDPLLAGMAHNLGDLLLAGAAPRLARFGDDDIEPATADRQQSAPGADRLGALLLELWKAPAAVASCARHGREPEKAEPEYRPLLALVGLSRCLASLLDSHPPPEPVRLEALSEWRDLFAGAPWNGVANPAESTLRRLPESLVAANHVVAALGG